MKINAKTLNEDSFIWTRDLIRKTYGFDITRFNKKVVNKSIFEQLNLTLEQFQVFERIYNARGDIFPYLMNYDKDLPWTYYYLTDTEREIFWKNDEEGIDIAFRLYAIGKLPPDKKKTVLDFYNNFWDQYFLNLPLLNNYSDDDLSNNHEDNYYTGQYDKSKIDSYFYIDTYNMFGIKDIEDKKYFLLNPYGPNFIYLNLEKIQNSIINLLKKNINSSLFFFDQKNIILRTYHDEDTISKINFHNIQSPNKNQKMINITFDIEKIHKLIHDITIEKKHHRKIYIESGEKEIKKIYYPVYFEIAFEAYLNKDQRSYLNEINNFKDLAINCKLTDSFYDDQGTKTLLPQFTFGKLHFNCLIDLNVLYILEIGSSSDKKN